MTCFSTHTINNIGFAILQGLYRKNYHYVCRNSESFHGSVQAYKFNQMLANWAKSPYIAPEPQEVQPTNIQKFQMQQLTLSSSWSTLSLNLISSISLPSQSTELDDPLKPFAVLELPTPPCPRLADAMCKFLMSIIDTNICNPLYNCLWFCLPSHPSTYLPDRTTKSLSQKQSTKVSKRHKETTCLCLSYMWRKWVSWWLQIKKMKAKEGEKKRINYEWANTSASKKDNRVHTK